MTHLTDEMFYHLAEQTCEAKLLSYEEQKQLDHIKACKECFEKYCVFATILDATSLSCGLVFEPIEIVERKMMPAKKLLAAIKITCNRVQDTLSLMGEQIQQITSAFLFEQILTTGIRGSNREETSALYMEDIEDEETFLVYDPRNHRLMIQINAEEKKIGAIRVYLTKENKIIMDIVLNQEGAFIKGILTDIPEDNLEVIITEK